MTVLLLAATAAACSNSDSPRLKDRLFTGSTANQKAIINSADRQPLPPPIAGGSDTVTRASLPPPPQTTVIAGNDQYAPMQLSSASAGEQGYTWTAVGGTVITVGRGETLNSLAVKYGVPPAQILTANQLTSANQVLPGRILVIPHRVALAPSRPAAPAPVAMAATAPPAAPPIAAGAPTYVVQTGDTLYSISRRSGASVNGLVALNGLASADQIRVGQTLRLPAGASAPAMAYAQPPAKPAATATAVASSQPRIQLKSPADTAASGSQVASIAPPKIPAAPSIPVETTPAPTPVAAATVIDETADPPSADGTSFRWPVRGRIISGFGTKPNGERNDGINLAVPEGTSVKAIEAGTVIYAGNELEGYGNLVLIRHADGWVSAYAHNKELLVTRGDQIRRGQTIAHAGMTGSVTAPQVHFELRKGAKPINPLDYLAG